MNKYQFNQIQLDEFFDAFVWLYVILQDIWISPLTIFWLYVE